MSADNIVIIEEGIDGIFRGYDRFVEEAYEPIDIKEKPIFRCDTVKEAQEAIEAYMAEGNVVEYGYSVIYLEGNSSKMDLIQMKKGISIFLSGLGLDLSDQHFKDTPNRIVKAYQEIFEGLEHTEEKIEKILKTAFKSPSDEMITVKNIHVFSMCPHHFLPVEYMVSVAYIPDGKVLGLSKLPRLVELLAKRPIIQEDFTREIAEKLMSINAKGAAVSVRGEHLCMRMRGVKQSESYAITNSVLGTFRTNASIKNEFLSQLGVL